MHVMYLTFSALEQLPRVGDTVVMQGLLNRYAVTIHAIQQQQRLDNGNWQLKVRATKKIIIETETEAKS